jgi:hypothetical protein
VFLPHLAITWIMQNIRDEDTVRLMDNSSPHLTPVVIDLFSTARVQTVTFEPHTTQIFQVFDLALFVVVKIRGQHELQFKDDAGSASLINKVYRDFRSTMIDMHLRRAFRGIGLMYHIVDGFQLILFNETTRRKSNGFRELRDILLTSLWRICRWKIAITSNDHETLLIRF